MANETLITDLVAKEAMEQLAQLDTAMGTTLEEFKRCATELAKGLKIPVEVTGDLDKLKQLYETQMQRASQATQQLTQQMQKQQQVVAQTTAQISQHLQQVSNDTNAMRQKIAVDQEAMQITMGIIGTIEENSSKLRQLNEELGEAKAKMAEYEAQMRAGTGDTEMLSRQMDEQTAKISRLNVERQQLNRTLSNEQKYMTAASGSYDEASQALNLMDRALRQATADNAPEEMVKRLTSAVQELRNALKKQDEVWGQHHRNVGNYAIAGEKMAQEMRDEGKASADLTTQLMSLIGIKGRLGASFKTMATGAAAGGNALTVLTTKVKAFGKASLALLTNPYVLALLGVAGTISAFKWWFDYNKGLIEASRQTKYFTGLTGDAMRSVRDQVQATADVYGKGFTETLRAANSIAKNMGITFQDATELISKGFAAGGANAQNFLGNIERYAPTFEKMGVSAEEFVAIMARMDTAGVQSQKTLTALAKASLQLRSMNKGTAESLKGIGIDAIQMTKDIQTGHKTTMQAMSEIAKKMKELGATSRESSSLMKTLFGARGESTLGEGFLTFLAESDKGMEELLGKEDSIARLKVQEVETQKKLNDKVAELFDTTGGDFETYYTKLKIIVKEYLIEFIDRLKELRDATIDWANKCIDLYNNLVGVRIAVQGIVSLFKSAVTVAWLPFNAIVAGAKAAGNVLHDLGMTIAAFFDFVKDPANNSFSSVTIAFNALKQSVKDIPNELATPYKDAGKVIGENFADGFDEAINGGAVDYLKKPNEFMHDGSVSEGYTLAKAKEEAKKAKAPTLPDLSDKAAASAARRAAEQARKAEEAELEARLELIENFHEKEMAKIKLQYLKKINAIKGEGEKQRAARATLEAAMQHALVEAETKYQENKEKTDIANRLAAAKKGSDEEYKLRLVQLRKQRDTEIEEAERTGADISLIRAKYAKQEADLAEGYADENVRRVVNAAAGEQAVRNAQYQQQIIDLNQWYTQAIEYAQKEGLDTTKISEQNDKEKREIDNRYANETLQGEIDSLTKQLAVANLNEEERERIRKELAKAVGDLAQEQSEQERKAAEDAVQADEEARKKRVQNLQDWVQRAGEAVAKISEFMGAMYDNQIAKIEEQMEAEQQRYDAEVAHIEELAERGAITTEEAEIRKRDAAAATQKKQEALEKRKSDLEYKKAVIEKANTVAQIGITTALGIMRALAMMPPNIPLSVFIGAMGAIQVATALAQPIKAYAEGTKGKPHPGGLALVGDGDKAELVMYNGKAWITPDEPTLVNLPRGAEVIPDLTAKDVAAIGSGLPLILPRERSSGQPIIINDYSTLESRVAANTKAVTKALKEHQRALTHQMRRQRFNNYIADRI